jgi:copper homeostasis protein (lipoprotein)
MTRSSSREYIPDSDLEITYWKLEEVGGEPAVLLPNQREAHFVLVPDEHRVRGSGGCNQFQGSYETEDNCLSFRQLVATRKTCPGIMEQERAFLQALESTTHYQIDGEKMDLFADEELVAKFAAIYL